MSWFSDCSFVFVCFLGSTCELSHTVFVFLCPLLFLSINPVLLLSLDPPVKLPSLAQESGWPSSLSLWVCLCECQATVGFAVPLFPEAQPRRRDLHGTVSGPQGDVSRIEQQKSQGPSALFPLLSHLPTSLPLSSSQAWNSFHKSQRAGIGPTWKWWH